MANYRSPGVYVEEISTLPPSIAEVESAVPAFVGYTSIVTNVAANDLINVPTPINNMNDYVQIFGGPDIEDPTHITIDIDEKQDLSGKTTGYSTVLTLDNAHMSQHILYHAVNLYFANGGTRCFITSVGPYTSSIAYNDLKGGLDAVGAIDGPTILVCPEAVNLPAKFTDLCQNMAEQAASLTDRFAILDTQLATVPKTTSSVGTDTTGTTTSINASGVAPYALQYAAVYYPHLVTSYNYAFNFDALSIRHYTINGTTPAPADPKAGETLAVIKPGNSTLYNYISAQFQNLFMTLPPSAAIAGVYCGIDNKIGVWKAPANIALSEVVKANVTIARSEQDLLNVNDQTGKSVNAILNSAGFGTVVMGARTLDGNDNEWRYINVRRFFITVEQSIKNSMGMFVFEPNTSATWVKVQAMVENYLFMKWRDGALAGAKPEQAYFVNIGLGSTMNSVDILEGRLIIQIGMAVARPAEFIVMQFEQMMQTS